MAEPRINSVLAADFGSVNTRALLFDLVDGEFRLVAQAIERTTIGSPADAAHLGLAAALAKVSETTGRRFLDEAGRVIRPEEDDRVGVDYFIITASAGPARRAVLVGLNPHGGIAAARRAIAPFYIDAVAEVHLDDGLGTKGRLNRIIHSRPQLILISGGTDGGGRTVLLEMLTLIREALSLMPLGRRPMVLYAGNSSLAASAREILSQLTELRFAPNIRQAGGASLEPLQTALGSYYDDIMGSARSFQRCAALSDSGILPSARGVETITAFFARSTGMDTLTIDAGSAKTALSLARKGLVHTAVRSDIGLGHSAASALEIIGEDHVAEWLPFHARKGELAQYTRNKGARLASVPLDMRERYIEYALLRAGIGFVSEGLVELAGARVGLIIVAGATMIGGGQGALDMMLLADALRLEGVVQVKSDPFGALPALGALAAAEPRAVVQLLNGNVLQNVGTLICLSGRAAAGAPALKVKVRQGTGERSQHEISAGDVWHLPAPATSEVELRIQTRRGLSIGGKRRLRLRAPGGRGGVLIDARLDALAAAKSMTERAVCMLRWYAAVTGQEGPVAIPESWLGEVE
ncbi:MAG: glutamate mutase L [Chloroflexi bacterium]|nr:glutamate mutase L [Chloroflexota bacterium]